VKSKENIVSFTAEELDARITAGKDRTNWERVDALTEEELEAAIAADPDEDLDEGVGPWFMGIPPPPPPKEYIHIGLDKDIVAWFRQSGRGYQTRINAVLRVFFMAHRGAGWKLGDEEKTESPSS